jgi:hypothetical protein
MAAAADYPASWHRPVRAGYACTLCCENRLGEPGPFSIAPDQRCSWWETPPRGAGASAVGVAGPHGVAAAADGLTLLLLTGGASAPTGCVLPLLTVDSSARAMSPYQPAHREYELRSVCREFHITAATATTSAHADGEDYIDALRQLFCSKSHAAGKQRVDSIDRAQGHPQRRCAGCCACGEANLGSSERKLQRSC